MFKVRKISLQLGGLQILKNISFDVKQKEVVGLIGPNGAGKSTFFNVLCGLYAPSSGSIKFSGDELIGKTPAEIFDHSMARTFQDTKLFPQITVLENLIVAANFTRRVNLYRVFLDRKKMKHEQNEIEKRAMELLKKVHMEDKAHVLAQDLSYGQGKLVEILKVIISDAKLILLDEPFSGLFPEMIKVISDLIREMVEADKTIILVEHNMKLIAEVTDRVIVLDSGEMIAEGPFKEVKKDKKVLHAYLGN